MGLENVIVTPHDIALVDAEEPRIVDVFIDNLRRHRDGQAAAQRARSRGPLLIAPADLERWMQALLEASGLEPGAAETVAVSLVHAAAAAPTRTASRVLVYAQRLRDGHMNRNPAPKVEREDGAVALVDGDQGQGRSRACSPPTSRSTSRAATAPASSPSTARATTAPRATTRSAPRRRG